MEKHELRTNNMKDHKDLDVWNKAMDLVEDIYILSKKFPHDEIYGLSSQVKRAVVSIPSNIAEGQGEEVLKSLFSIYTFLWDLLQKLKRKYYLHSV